MAINDLEAFDGLNVVTTELDEMEVAHLLQVREDLCLLCQDCGGRRFEVSGFIPAKLEILTGEHIVVSHIDYEKVVVNRVVKCAHCGCTDLVTITKISEKANGQE